MQIQSSMKNLILSISILSIVALMFSSCKRDSDPSGQGVSGTKELWAEQIESVANTKKPEGWSDADWNAVTKNVNYKDIFNTLTSAVLEGKQQAYNYITDTALTIDQVKSMMSKTDTNYVEDKLGIMTAKPVIVTLAAEDISVIRVREKWYFDKEKFKLETQSSAMALFVNSYAEDGSLRGIKPLFYVKLNN